MTVAWNGHQFTISRICQLCGEGYADDLAPCSRGTEDWEPDLGVMASTHQYGAGLVCSACGESWTRSGGDCFGFGPPDPVPEGWPVCKWCRAKPVLRNPASKHRNHSKPWGWCSAACQGKDRRSTSWWDRANNRDRLAREKAHRAKSNELRQYIGGWNAAE